MQRRNTKYKNLRMTTITDSKILLFERDLKSRVNQRFHIDTEAYDGWVENLKCRNEEIRLLVSDILDTVSEKILEDNDQGNCEEEKVLIEPKDIQNLFSCVSSLPGMSDVFEREELRYS